jgi:hypothetical protein
MAKIDLKKELKQFYHPSAKEVSVVDVPAMKFLMADGRGDPNASPEYAGVVEALYAVAYTLKFTIKREREIDFAVMPLEGLWWVEDMSQFSVQHKEDWLWTMMIMQPDYITADGVMVALADVAKKKKLALLDRIRFEPYHEGLSAQIMHLGPYAAEAPTIARLHNFIEANGYQRRGKHHEIYLGDSRKTAPEKLQTVIRQPMA